MTRTPEQTRAFLRAHGIEPISRPAACVILDGPNDDDFAPVPDPEPDEVAVRVHRKPAPPRDAIDRAIYALGALLERPWLAPPKPRRAQRRARRWMAARAKYALPTAVAVAFLALELQPWRLA